MFLANIKLGFNEFNATFIFQIVNILLLIGLIALFVFFIKFVINNYNNHKKLNAIDRQLSRLEELLESEENND